MCVGYCVSTFYSTVLPQVEHVHFQGVVLVDAKTLHVLMRGASTIGKKENRITTTGDCCRTGRTTTAT